MRFSFENICSLLNVFSKVDGSNPSDINRMGYLKEETLQKCYAR